MGLQITRVEAAGTQTAQVPAEAKRSGHTKPKAPTIDLSQPGRLRVSNLMALFGVSHSTLYAGIRKGRYPKETGMDGRMPWWSTEAIRQFLGQG